jgi:hypothetical protein
MVNGKIGSVLVPSEKSGIIIKAYEIYKEPKTSLADIIKHIKTFMIEINCKLEGNIDRSHLSKLLKTPLYVRADKDVYQYLISKGIEIIDDVEAFDGVHGLFLHKRSDGSKYIKVGYHEGLVDSQTWLAVQDKKAHNIQIPSGNKPKNTWLTGLIKCEYCGCGICISYSLCNDRVTKHRYFIDMGANRLKGCIKRTLVLRPNDVERIVYEAMKERICNIEISNKRREKPNKEIENLKLEVIQIDKEIKDLLDKLYKSNEVLFRYIQERIELLHKKKSDVELKLDDKVRKRKSVDIKPLVNPLDCWETLSVSEKHEVAKIMIDVIYLSDENGINIKFSI